jgi:hypothetical protein
MVASAAVLAAAGLALLFAADELQRYMNAASTAVMPAFTLQLWGAGLLGLASANWIARGVTLGGIYGRAIVLGNVAHWTIGGLAGLRAALDRPGAVGLWTVAAVYTVFAVAFGWLLRRDPLPARASASGGRAATTDQSRERR